MVHGHPHARLVPAPNLTVDEVLVQPGPRAIDLLYVTDRRDLNTRKASRAYGFDRGVAVRVGTARLVFGGPGDDEALRERTSTAGRRAGWPLSVDEVYEHGTLGDGSLVQQLTARLGAAGSGDVYLSIHGIGAGFADSLYDMAQWWHHLGRPGVPLVYSWPTGRGGFIQNVYRYDRDSGDFTIPHLTRLLRVLVATPEVERVVVVAHSRGTAVLVDTLRELRLELLADGREPLESKLSTVVLAAPDFDIGLFEQRVLQEGVLEVTPRTVLFISDEDAKLMADGWMHGGTRVGQAHLEDVAHLAQDRAGLEIFDSAPLRRGGRHDHHLAAPDSFAHLLRVLVDQPPPREAPAAEAESVGDTDGDAEQAP